MKKQAVLMKQAVAPLQAIEVGIIRKKLASFDVKQHKFREGFRRNAPFSFDSELIYSKLDEVSRSALVTCAFNDISLSVCMLIYICSNLLFAFMQSEV